MVHIRSGRPRGPADGLGRPYVERQHHEGCRDRGILPDPGACGVYRRVPVHHACIRAIAPPYSRNHSICTPAGRRPSTASPCQHQHRRVVGETRSPPRLEHARHGYDRRGRDGQAAGPQRPSLRLQSCWPPAPSAERDLRYTLWARPLVPAHETWYNTASSMCSLYCATRSRRPELSASVIGTVRRKRRKMCDSLRTDPPSPGTSRAVTSPMLQLLSRAAQGTEY